MPVSPSELRARLKEQFGYESFRPGQERIIRTLLEGGDVLAVLPTGAGKSLVFQLAAQLLPGITIVVSPLIALMKDQVDSIEDHGLEVSLINSTQSAVRSKDELRKVQDVEARLLYITPERFEDGSFLTELQNMEVSLMAVDEAHCMSEWGFDFRPSYLGLGKAAAQLGRPTLLALTATATPWVRQDIIERLGLRNPAIVVHDVDRPNLFFEVHRVLTEEEEARALRNLLLDSAGSDGPEISHQLDDAMQKSGIIYTATTKAAQETAAWLREWGITADYYHGGRKKSDRERVQEAFMSGEVRVITATNAFGLGVDKPDVGFVIHRDIPASLEAYYQEAGRAGRDGQPARCALIYRDADLGRAAFLSGSGQISQEDVEKVHACLMANRQISTEDLAEKAGLSKARVTRLAALLAQEGLVEEKEEGLLFLTSEFDPAQVSLETEESRHAYERSRLQMMRGYAELRDCRRKYLLNYFGQEMEVTSCGRCDNDFHQDQGVVHLEVESKQEEARDALTTGQRVIHAQWGAGRVIEMSEDCITVLLDSQEVKRLAASLVLDQGLLTPDPELGTLEGPHPGDHQAAKGETSPFAIGERVFHDAYGEGDVQRVTEDSITILFEQAGYKTLARETLEGHGQLRPITG